MIQNIPLTNSDTRVWAGLFDSVCIRNEELITFEQGKEAEVLLFDLRANEVPSL